MIHDLKTEQMIHDLKTEEVRPVQTENGKTPATLYAWCVCGGWSMQFSTFHRGPVLDAFFLHLQAAADPAQIPHDHESGDDAEDAAE